MDRRQWEGILHTQEELVVDAQHRVAQKADRDAVLTLATLVDKLVTLDSHVRTEVA